MILWLLGCADPGAWPAAPHVFRGVVKALGPGDRAAYEAAAPPVAPDFTTLDADGDGHLSEAEIATYVLATDPTTFDPAFTVAPPEPRGEAPPGTPRPPGTPPQPGAPPPLGAHRPPGVPPGVQPGGAQGVPPGVPQGPPLPGVAPSAPPARVEVAPRASHLLEALRFELAVIHARAPAAPLPTDAELQEAARLGVASAEGKAILARLRSAADGAGLAWPTSLGG